ncbi:MAG: FmdB family zinc ribbon protein [Candidatus Nanopelagicus sp.]
MPTYEYLCNQCEHGFEVVQSFTDAAIQVCPKCNGDVRKIYNNVGVVFKGTGFYKTDSRSTPASKPDTTAPKSESAAPIKKDSKPTTNS